MPADPAHKPPDPDPLLSESDFAAALALVQQCDATPDMDAFQEAVLDLIEIVPGAMSVYNEIDLRSGVTTGSSRPPFDDFERQAGIFNTYMHQHPVINHMSETGDTAPLAISDCLRFEQLEQLELYREFFAPLGYVDQIAVGLPSSAELVVGLAISRTSIGFSERDRSILRLLAPHLGASYLAARARSTVAEQSSGGAAQMTSSTSLVVIDQAGAVSSLVGPAEAVLERYLGAAVALSAPLPSLLQAELDRRAAPTAPPEAGDRSAMVELAAGDDGTLRARLIDGRVPGAAQILILEEDRDRVDAARAGSLGLSGREREVANQLARARSNDEIADRLAISPHTVKRHLEHLYEKLDANSRAEAIVQLLGSP